MQKKHAAAQRLYRVLFAALAGGSLCQTCETRFRDAFVQGTRTYISTLLDPRTIFADAIADSGEVDE
jgi:hypothetical protein